MVFFAITRNGFLNYKSLGQSDIPLWVASGVLSVTEISELRASGMDVTDFDYEIKREDQTVIEWAVVTIKEHHPDQCVWVEA